MSSGAFSGVGTTFKRSDMASTPTFTAIAEINSINGPSMSRDTIDVTSLDSTGGYREFIAGFRDGGEITLNMNFTVAGYDALKDDFESETRVDYKIVLDEGGTNETSFDFEGLVTSLGLSVPMDDKVTTDVTIKISGQVTMTS